MFISIIKIKYIKSKFLKPLDFGRELQKISI